jgi:hypothetical protein
LQLKGNSLWSLPQSASLFPGTLAQQKYFWELHAKSGVGSLKTFGTWQNGVLEIPDVPKGGLMAGHVFIGGGATAVAKNALAVLGVPQRTREQTSLPVQAPVHPENDFSSPSLLFGFRATTMGGKGTGGGDGNV